MAGTILLFCFVFCFIYFRKSERERERERERAGAGGGAEREGKEQILCSPQGVQSPTGLDSFHRAEIMT